MLFKDILFFVLKFEITCHKILIVSKVNKIYAFRQEMCFSHNSRSKWEYSILYNLLTEIHNNLDKHISVLLCSLYNYDGSYYK